MSNENETQDVLRTPAEWCLIEGVEVLDPDGWRGRNGRPWTDPISLAEFKNRLVTSTLRRITAPSAAAATVSESTATSATTDLPPAPQAGSKRLPEHHTTPTTTHELKTWTDFFQAIVDGRKNFEVRYNDRGFQAGDYVRLIEIDSRYTSRRTGRIIDARIGYVLSQPVGRAGASFDGFVAFSLLGIKEGRL